MLLFKLYVTTWQNIAQGRNIRIKDNNYHVDIYTPEHLENYPDEIQSLELHEGHQYFKGDFSKYSIIEIG